MTDLTAQRRFFAEEIQMAANLKSAALVEALASVARERFLPPGPWTVKGEGDFQAAPRQTPDADPRHVYHNVAIAIDTARTLFNGAPGVIAMALDALNIRPGEHALHIGTGLGYYTALLAQCVGPTGRVLGIEVDDDLAQRAGTNLAPQPWVETRHGQGAGPFDETFDVMLVNAGVTHPLDAWLAALRPGGRMVIPLTMAMPGMGTIGKGPLFVVTRTADPARFTARIIGFVAIYSALGLRDDSINALIGQTLAKSPYAPIKTLRRDPHAAAGSCWLHAPGFCLSLEG